MSAEAPLRPTVFDSGYKISRPCPLQTNMGTHLNLKLQPVCKINYAFLSFVSNDVDMETDHYSNGVTETSSNGFLNGSSKHDHEMEECDTEMGLQLHF